MLERLQKILSRAGVCSRRGSEALLNAGRVSVNGEIAAVGMSADIECDVIAVDGVPLSVSAERVYIMLHKPRGYVTTLSDEKGRKDVSMLVEDAGKRVYPVGRLDMQSEGLLLMTDDGDIAYKLMHPSHEIDKTYNAWVTGDALQKSFEDMRKSMDIDGYMIKPAVVRLLRYEGEWAVLAITIHEGRNRQIRKMCDKCGLKLHRLVRISEGELRLGTLKCGAWRHLTTEELRYLQEL